MKIKIKKAIHRAIEFINKKQKNDSYFGYETIFPMILIFDCLNEIETKQSFMIRNIIKDFLLKEKSEYWSFNYWKKNSIQCKNEPYPDDLDDTCCALAALMRFNKKIINGKALAKIINLFLVSEEKEGGPYRTWILPKDKASKWRDIDLAVNSNVGYFLNLNRIELKNLNRLVEDRIKLDDIYSPFYKGEIPIIYFISRFYKGKFKLVLKNKLLKSINNKITVLNLALAISSLIRLGYADDIKEEWINNLLNHQDKVGAWPKDDLYFYRDNKGLFVGNKCITTAFAIQALSLFKDYKSDNKLLGNEIKKFKKNIKIKAKILFKDYPKLINKSILNLVDEIIQNDKYGIITSTPLFLYKSLNKVDKKLIDANYLLDLGLINLLGWGAYTIYDDILDIKNNSNKLPIANLIHQEMIKKINSLKIDKKTGFFNFYQKILKETEFSNFYELNNWRLEKNQEKFNLNKFDLVIMAKKSMGHCISSVAILCKLKIKVDSEEIKNLINYFKNFIIAKQMNDDAHDWLLDLSKGQINSANFEILRLNCKKNLNTILTKNKNQLKLDYWKLIIPSISNTIISKSKKAIFCLKKIKRFDNIHYLLELCQNNICLAEITLEERKNTLDFINNYYQK